MKLIEADVFESVLDFADADVCEESPDGQCEFGFSRDNIRELLRDIPAVDAVPVVRCRECNHKNHDSVGRPWCDMWEAQLFNLDGFCSYGERKEGAD